MSQSVNHSIHRLTGFVVGHIDLFHFHMHLTRVVSVIGIKISVVVPGLGLARIPQSRSQPHYSVASLDIQ